MFNRSSAVPLEAYIGHVFLLRLNMWVHPVDAMPRMPGPRRRGVPTAARKAQLSPYEDGTGGGNGVCGARGG